MYSGEKNQRSTTNSFSFVCQHNKYINLWLQVQIVQIGLKSQTVLRCRTGGEVGENDVKLIFFQLNKECAYIPMSIHFCCNIVII